MESFIRDLGPQVRNATSHAGTFATDAQGRPLLYVVLDGATGIDARLAAVDLNTEQVVLDRSIPGCMGSWRTITSFDGSIYIGSYNDGHLYRYVPETDTLEDLGRPHPETLYTFALFPVKDGSVYGGTYPDASFFRYKPGEGFTLLGPTPIEPNELYLRCNVYDPVHEVSYCGIGSHAHLKRYDHRTGAITELLPEAYASDEFVYDLNLEGGKLFVRLAPSLRMLVFDLESDGQGGVKETFAHEVPNVACLGVSPEHAGKVYYVSTGGGLHAYDLSTGGYSSVGVQTSVFSLRFGFVRLEDQQRFPGETLIGFGTRHGQTHVFKYNPVSGVKTSFDIPIEGNATNLQTIYSGSDGMIYTGAFLVGGIGIYSPAEERLVADRKGVGQTESMAELGGKLYFGVYPHAKLFEYDLSQPWSLHEDGANPVKLFDLLDEEQDRPYGMTVGGGKLYVSTICGYGKLGGAIMEYDPLSRERRVYRNPLTELSIIRLVYRAKPNQSGGVLYGATTVYGGLGIKPTQTEAQLLIFDTTTGQARGLRLPVPDLKAITALTEGPDGLLWGMAEGYLFGFDPAEERFTSMQQLFPEVTYGQDPVWSDASLLFGKDGQLYGTIGRKWLFRVDPATIELRILDDTGAKFLAADSEGCLYYSDGRTQMKVYSIESSASVD